MAQPLEQYLRLGYRERSQRAARALADVSLGADFLSRYPDQLSGGERQRVAIARALVVEPDLLICDEVTSALDVSVQAVIVELLRGLQAERRIAMIFITHNLALVRSIAQSVVVLREGAVVEAGPVGQVLDRPADPYTARLMQDVPKLARPGLRTGPSAQGAAASSRSPGPPCAGSAHGARLQVSRPGPDRSPLCSCPRNGHAGPLPCHRAGRPAPARPAARRCRRCRRCGRRTYPP